MKRSSLLIGAVATMAAGSALAQSSVTIYGRVNTTAEYQIIEDAAGNEDKTKVLNNNASRLGFKGTEDLGGGLKANFFLEHRFNSDDGAVTNPSQFWSGDAYAGLSGGFGEIRAGAQISTAYYATADWVSMHNHDTGTSADAIYYNARAWNSSNKVAYITPEMAGLTAELQVGAGEGNGQEKAFDLGVYYKLGGLALGLGAEKQGDNKQVALRAAYTLGDFTFGGYYQRADDDNVTGVVGGAGKRNIFRLSGMYALGASEFHINVGKAGDWDNVADSGTMQATVGYNYNLSKNTKVYAYYSQLKNDDGLAALTDLKKAQYVAAGLRVNF